MFAEGSGADKQLTESFNMGLPDSKACYYFCIPEVACSRHAMLLLHSWAEISSGVKLINHN